MAEGVTTYVNRIGLGVDVDDPGGASLRHLREVRSEIRAILELSRQMASVRLPRLASLGGASSRGGGQTRADIAQQGRLFSDGVARQQSLFTQAEVANTRTHRAAARQRTLDSEQEYEKDVQNYTRAQRRKANREKFELQQRLSTTPAREAARREGEFEAEYQTRMQRRALNERINNRANLEAQRREEELQAAARADLPRRRRLTRQALREGQSPEDVEGALPFRGRAVAERYSQALQSRREREVRAEEERRREQARTDNAVRVERLAREEQAQRRREADRAPREEFLRRYRAGAFRYDQNILRSRADTLQARRNAPYRYQEEQDARDSVALGLRAERGLLQEKRRLREEFLREEQTRLGREERNRAVNPFVARQRAAAGALDSRGASEIDKARDSLTRFQREAQRISLRRAGTEVGNEAAVMGRRINGLQAIARNLREELGKPANMRRTREEIDRDLGRVQTRIKAVAHEMRNLREQDTGAGPTGGEGGGGKRNPFSALSIASRITRNFLIYRAINTAVFGTGDFIAESVKAARAADDLTRGMAQAARDAHSTLGSYIALSERLRIDLGRGRTQSRQLVTESSRFAENRPDLVEPLARTIADIAAARGEGESPADLAEQFRRRESKFYKRYLGETIEEVYASYAAPRVDQNRDIDRLRVGPKRGPSDDAFKTRSELIKQYVSNMTEAQREEAAYQAILARGNEVEGAAAQRAQGLAGQLDRTNERWQEIHENLGGVILRMKTVRDLIASIADLLEKFDGGQLIPTGPGGQITPQDVQRTAQQRADSYLTRAAAKGDAYGGAGKALAGILGAGFLAGRGIATPAVEGGRITLTRTVTAGLNRIVGGMATQVRQIAGATAEEATAATALEGGSLAALPIAVVAAVGLLVVGISSHIREQAELSLARVEAETSLEGERLSQLDKARKEGRERFFIGGVHTPNPAQTELFDKLSLQERQALILQGQGREQGQSAEPEGLTEEEFFRRYAPEQRAQLFRDNRVQRVIAAPEEEDKALRDRYDISKNPDMIRQREEFWAGIRQKEEEEAQKTAELQGRALAQLREMAQGSFRIVDEVAQQRTVDNPYVKIFTDAVTAADRMKQAWGFLGETTVGYFTKLEQGRIGLQKVGVDFQNLAQAQELYAKAEREQAERDLSPDLTREEQAYEGLAQSIVLAAQKIPQLEMKRREVMQGVVPDRYDRERAFRQQLEGIDSARRLGTGLDAQGQRAIRRATSEAILQAADESGLTPRQIQQTPALRERYGQAIDDQIAEQRAAIQDNVNRIRLIQLERQRAQEEARQTANLREEKESLIYGKALFEGRGTYFENQFVGQLTPEEKAQLRRIGQVADQSLIRVTDRLSPREMGADLFQARNESIRREAERQTSQQEEALAAAQEGVNVMKEIRDILAARRAGVLGGDLGLAIEITNETQARVDEEALKDANSGFGPKNPGADPQINPYAGAFGRFDRGGRRQ